MWSVAVHPQCLNAYLPVQKQLRKFICKFLVVMRAYRQTNSAVSGDKHGNSRNNLAVLVKIRRSVSIMSG